MKSDTAEAPDKTGAEGEGGSTPGPEAAQGDDGGRFVTIAGRRFRVPGSPGARLGVGSLLVVGGVLGFLPVLGFWMIPLGLLILSVDLPSIRRKRRLMDVWVGRRMNGRRANGKAEETGRQAGDDEDRETGTEEPGSR